MRAVPGSWGLAVTGLPVPPGPCRYDLPDPRLCGPDDCVAVGADLAPSTLVTAYRIGLFPMHLPSGELGWWSPVERGVLPLDGMEVSRSLRRSMRRYRVSVDLDFAGVLAGCADPSRPGGWINDEIVHAYTTLHRMGWAHSVETWDGDDLVGGFYGVSWGAAFFGESMFHTATDASKVALARFVEWFDTKGGLLLDVQWATDHLRTLGAVTVDRLDYLDLLDDAARRSHLDWRPGPIDHR